MTSCQNNPHFYLYEPFTAFHLGDVVWLRKPDGTVDHRKMVVTQITSTNIHVEYLDADLGEMCSAIYTDDLLTHNSPTG